MASWQNVAGALHWMEEMTALKAVNVFLQYTPTGELTSHGKLFVCLVGRLFEVLSMCPCMFSCSCDEDICNVVSYVSLCVSRG